MEKADDEISRSDQLFGQHIPGCTEDHSGIGSPGRGHESERTGKTAGCNPAACLQDGGGGSDSFISCGASVKVSAQFQNELLENIKLYGRKGPFPGALMVEIQFWAGERNSPEVHTLAKHYLDLLQKPAAGVSLNRSRVLIRDDAQIEFLS